MFYNLHIKMVKQLENTNNATVTQLILDALRFIWPDSNQAEMQEKFSVLLTDGAAYMIKAGTNLKQIYPNLLHITCVAHGMHRVAELIRSSYKKVDQLVASVKAIFKKSPSRVRLYKQMCPGLPLPPEPIIVRWGTWLTASEFLATHYTEIKSVILALDGADAECIRKAQKLLRTNDEELSGELAEINVNFTFLAGLIKGLEDRKLSLVKTISLIEDARGRLASCNSRFKDKVMEKFTSVLSRNPDFHKMQLIAGVLSGSLEGNTCGLNPDALSSLAFCPMTSVEVERSFSMSKSLLSSRRMNFTMENFEKTLICHYNLCLDENLTD